MICEVIIASMLTWRRQYSCLRNYYNQKYHDRLKRGYVVTFLEEILKRCEK